MRQLEFIRRIFRRPYLIIAVAISFLLTSIFAALMSVSDTSIYFVLFIAALLIGLFLFIKPWWGSYLLILSFPFISYLSRGTFIPGLKPDEALIIICFLIAMISPFVKNRFYFSSIDYVFLFVIAIVGFSSILGPINRGTSIYWQQILSIIKSYMIFRLVLITIDDRTKLSKVLKFLLIPSVIVSIIAIFQLLDLAGMRNHLAEIYPDTYAVYVAKHLPSFPQFNTLFRATSTIGNWNAFGAYSVFGACLSLALLTYPYALKKIWLVPITLGTNIGSLVMTGSSNSIIGFGVGLVTWWWLKPRNLKNVKFDWKKIVLAIIIVSIILGIAGSTVLTIQYDRQFGSSYVLDRTTGKVYSTHGLPESVLERWYLARYVIDLLLKDSLAFWIGFGRGEDAIAMLPWGTPESGYVGMLFFYGVFFLIAYLILFATIFVIAGGIRKQLGSQDELGQAIVLSVIIITAAVVVMNIIHSYYLASGVVHYYWILVGCMMVLVKTRQSFLAGSR